jgi:L-lactate utilization protein LutC
MYMTETTLSNSTRNTKSIVDEFSDRFVKQAGVIYTAKNPDDAVSAINNLIKQRGKGESCCAQKLELIDGGSITDIAPRIEVTIRFEDLQKKSKELANLLDVGITKADYGIAETGSIVDISYTDDLRLLSSFSRVHIAVLEKSKIVAKLEELSPRMKELLMPGSGKKPTITFIGGPSRTSDIELKSVLGVHGPHEVHVVLI